MAAEHPSTLFHFTNEPKFLQGILRDTFYPSIARERIENIGPTKEFGVPMVSFCDIRLSELNFHMKKYGEYGIGLTKEWAQRQGLNPVIYINKESELTTHLLDGIEQYFNHLNNSKNPSDSKLDDSYMKILNIERYIKNYHGDLIRGGVNIGKYTFADEREWRYVLPLNTPGFHPFVPISLIATQQEKENWNNMLKSHKLAFAASDIKYIIVKKDSSAKTLRRFIAVLPNYSEADKDHLKTRIITAEQIRQDM